MTLRIDGFDWVDELAEKIRAKHGIEPENVESALLNTDPEAFAVRVDDGKYRAWAQTEGGDYLFVVFAMPRRYIARVISARTMTSAEKSRYRRELGM